MATRKSKHDFDDLAPLAKLVAVMARLRDPDGGCPWDLEQNFQSIAKHTIEETYEVVEAIEQGDPRAIKDELGDLLFQIVFYAQMGREAGLFDLDQIAEAVADKMIERHPHVFGDPPTLQGSSFGGRAAKTSAAVVSNWETDKAAKREAQAKAENRSLSALDGVNTALPAISRALKLQNRAARTGFDWPDAKNILAKIREEMGELEVEMKGLPEQQALSNPLPLEGIEPAKGSMPEGIGRVGGPQQGREVNERQHQAELPEQNKDRIEDELGDVFFALVNLARRLEVDPETALRRTNRKFERRFREIETRLAAQGRKLDGTSLIEMERIWVEIKTEEKQAG